MPQTHLNSPEPITTTHGRPCTLPNYAAHDFLREGEEQEYAGLLTSLLSELSPEGVLEQTFAAEIVGATWRLRRCRLVEEAFGGIADLDFDPMTDERTEKQQRSVDRARSQSHLILRRSIAELRKLQTQRTILLHAEEPDVPRLTDIKQVGNALKAINIDTAGDHPEPHSGQDISKMSMDEFEAMLGLSDAQLRHLDTPGAFATPDAPPQDPAGSFCNPAPAAVPANPAPAGSFCKPALSTPRCAPCPCGSGLKFKRCCAQNPAGRPNSSPSALNRAA